MLRRLLLPFVVMLAMLSAVCARADNVTVFAAASLKEALDDIAAGFHEATDHTATVVLAGSSVLARQIRQGAPADVFISASPDWMDDLEREGLLVADTRFDLVGNTLVLIAHDSDASPVTADPGRDLAGLLGTGRLAMALVDAVPAGIYGKAALTSLGLWDEAAPRVAQADNVRAALALVATGEAPLGIVYATDAAAERRVSVVATFPESSHPPIVYPVAAITDTEAAASMLAYLRSDAAREAFARHGFVPLAN